MEKHRCSRCLRHPDYIRYHDEERGVPMHDESKHFEMLLLETMQAGLSWWTILQRRENYRKAFALDYNDGDSSSFVSYNYGISTLINNKSRVYKGGSWRDRGYYLSPGTRRFVNEDQSSDDIGFRCAMVRVGSPDGNMFGGQSFKEMQKVISKNQKARKL